MKISKIKDNFLTLAPLVVAAMILATFVNYTLKTTSREILFTAIENLEPKFLLVTFLAMIVFFSLKFKDIKKLFAHVKTSTWIFLMLIFILAISIRVFLTPSTHRLFFDEDIYLDIGKEILLRGKGGLCNYGDANGCYEYDLMKWPNGFPFLLSLAYLIFGISEATAFNLTIFLGSLTVVVIFFIGYLLGNERIGLYAALLFALIPVHIMWSATTASEPYLAFFSSFAVLCFILSFKINDWKTNALALSSFAYALQIKAEGIVFLLIFPLMIFLLDKNWSKKVKEKKFLLTWLLFLFLITPFLVHMNFAFKTDPWGSEGQKFGIEYWNRNVPENFWFWIKGYPTIEHPTLFTMFALLGAAFLFSKNKNLGIFLILWFGIFFVLYASFYAGSVRYGVDVRYTLSQYPAFILLAAFGMFFIEESFSKNRRLVAIVLVGITILSFYFYLPSISTPANAIEEARQAREYHDFAVANAEKLDENCYVLSHVPSIYLVMNKGSLQTWNGQNTERMKELFERTDCVYFDDGFWCNLEPYKSSVCKHMFDTYNLTEVSRLEERTGHVYTFYKVSSFH